MGISPMTPVELARATATPALFAETASGGKWKIARHLAHLDRALYAACTKRGSNRLIITCPPRHGKSFLCSKYLPAWYLGKFPDKRVIMTGHGADFASIWGARALQTLSDNGSMFGLNVPRKQSIERWNIPGRDGGMDTAGVNGPITGKGADLLILDDVIKNSEEANSETYRKKTWEWWQSTAFTRLEPDGVAIVILTRWHEDDLAGRLLRGDSSGEDAEFADKWHLINMPAIAEDGDCLGRKPGEALWPERWSIERLRNKRAGMRQYWWSAMFQQRPTPEEGGMFKRAWLRDARAPETIVRAVRYWDKAATAGGGDYTVGCLILHHEGGYHIAHVERGQWSSLEREKVIERTTARDQETYGGKVKGWFEQEPGSGGKESAEATIRRLAGYSVRAERVTGDKATRADPLAAQCEAGNVTVEKGAGWAEAFKDELCMFPNGTHDDQVDAASGAFNKLARKTGFEVYIP